MSADSSFVISMLDRYENRIVPVTGQLYVVSEKEVFLADDDLHWKHGNIIRVTGDRIDAVVRTIAMFCPPCGGGRASYIVPATVRGKVIRAANADDKAWLTEVEEVEVRDDWLTARMRLKDAEV